MLQPNSNGSSGTSGPGCERETLACVLVQSGDEGVWGDVSYLEPEDFEDDHCRAVYEHMQKVRSEGGAIDPALIVSDVKVNGASVAPFVSDLVATQISSVNVAHYARRVKREAVRRKARVVTRQCMRALEDPSKDLDEVLGVWQQHALTLAVEAQPNDFALSGQDLVNLIYDKESRAEGKPVTTGFPDLDTALRGGFRPGNLVILGGHSSMGKTTLAVSLVTNQVLKGHGVLFNSVEVSEQEFGEQMAHGLSGCSNELEKVLFGHGTDSEKGAYMEAGDAIAESPIFVTRCTTVEALRKHVARAKAQLPSFDLLYVDYLQLMRAPKVAAKGTRQEVVAHVSRELKAIAQEYKIAVVALSQVNPPDGRTNKRPLLSDTRESKALGHDADIVMFVYRDDYYDPKLNRGKAEVIVAKQRHGKTGTVYLRFEPARRRFTDWDVGRPPREEF